MGSVSADITPEEKAQIIAEYKAGLGVGQIGLKFKKKYYVVAKLIRAEGIMRSKKQGHALVDQSVRPKPHGQ
jgi:hypothetical protein